MVFLLTNFLVAALAARNVFTTPIPPPDCAFDTPNPCTVASTPHGAIPGNPLPPREALPCPLGGDCGPIVVDPTPTSASSASLPSATTCTPHRGAVPIGTECFESGPHAGQCISFECLDRPNTCGCPDAPPPASTPENRSENTPSKRALEGDHFIGGPGFQECDDSSQCSEAIPRRDIVPTPIGTFCELDGSGCVCLDCEKEKRRGSELIGEVCFENGTCITLECLADPNSSPTCLTQKEKRSEALPIPIGSICFENGTCTTIECLDHPDSPTCLAEKEKRSEGEHVKRDDSGRPLHGGHGPVCVEPVCESCPDLPECTSDIKRSPQEQENCHYVACDGGLMARSDEDGICLCPEPFLE